MQSRLTLKIALLTSTLGLALASVPAVAQGGYGPYGSPGYGAPPEGVEVYGQRFRVEGGRMNETPQKVSLSTTVRYDDLNLRTRRGQWELRQRVRAAAWD